jgi:dual specificity phosphatase 3
MADFNFVTGRLATGAALNGPQDVAQLVQAGITHVIDCRGEFDDAPLFIDGNMSYLWLPTNDDGQPKPPDWFDKGIQFALDALTHHKTVVLAHCAAGVNRGPSMLCAILMALGFTQSDSIALIRARRPQANIAYAADATVAVIELGWVRT